jgi:peroxiredoxin
MSNSEQIPGFRLPASTGHTLEYEAFRGKVPLALVFVPDAHTANGVDLLEELDRRLRDFGAERSQALAVVKETARSVRELAEERGLAVPILADASGSMARDFGAAEADHAVALVADAEGRIKRRFDPFFDGTDPTPAVESLLNTIRAPTDD